VPERRLMRNVLLGLLLGVAFSFSVQAQTKICESNSVGLPTSKCLVIQKDKVYATNSVGLPTRQVGVVVQPPPKAGKRR
jgi:hypothetical protein